MKIDVIVKPTSDKAEKLIGKSKTFIVDLDYIDDYDDIIGFVEGELYETFGESLHYQLDFDIANSVNLCEQIFSEAW